MKSICAFGILTESVSLFTHKCGVLEQNPSSDIKNGSKIHMEMNQSVLKHKNVGQDLNELQASSIWCTCDKSHSCISRDTFQRRDSKYSVGSVQSFENTSEGSSVHFRSFFAFIGFIMS